MKRKIVICDDDAEILKAFSMVIEDDYTTVVTVANSILLPEILDSLDADILFIDLQMPNKNGDQVIEELRRSSQHKKLPIVMISASAQGRELALESGADGFLAKPFDINDVQGYIRRFVYER